MLKLSERNKLRKLKGGREISILKIYSIKERGNIINILRHGIKIRSFPNNVEAREIEKYITKYEKDQEKKQKKLLKDYCLAPMCTCSRFENCDECDEYYKERALERKKKGKKIAKPGIDDVPNIKGLCSFPETNKRFLAKRFNKRWR